MLAAAGRAATAAATWRLDLKLAEVGAKLDDAGVASILLKGRAFASLFYDADSPRGYSDCDLYVGPHDIADAEEVLRRLGFEQHGLAPPGIRPDSATEEALHGGDWRRTRDGVVVDLHHKLPGVPAEPAFAWAVLAERTVPLDVAGWTARVLDPSASALLAALHAAHHGPGWPKPLRDLELALQKLDEACWLEARSLAERLEARPALGTGLRLVPAGEACADRLGVPWAPAPSMLLRWEGAPWGAFVWESLIRARGVRARASLLADVLFPPAEDLRFGSALARRGDAGLLAARILHPLRLAGRAFPALRAWRRGRGRADSWRPG